MQQKAAVTFLIPLSHTGPSLDAVPSDLLVKLQMDKADLEMAKQRLKVNAEKSAYELRRLRKTSVEALSKARRCGGQLSVGGGGQGNWNWVEAGGKLGGSWRESA